MSDQAQRPAHQTREEYVGLRVALVDAHRVSADLLALLRGELLVPVDDVEFLARRLHAFTRECLKALPPGER